MSFTINYQKEDPLGIFHIHGDLPLADAKDAWMRIYHALVQDNVQAILAFDHSIKSMSYTNVIEIVMWFDQISFPKNKKVAIVESSQAPDINKFGQDVSSVKGWNNIKVFSNEARAREWLEQPIA
jgi:hypothetical protein